MITLCVVDHLRPIKKPKNVLITKKPQTQNLKTYNVLLKIESTYLHEKHALNNIQGVQKILAQGSIAIDVPTETF